MRSVVHVFTSGLLSKVMAAASLVLLMRWLPTDQWANYAFAFAVASIGSSIVSLTFNMVFIVGERERTARDASIFCAGQLWICGALIAMSLLAWPLDEGLLLAAALLNLGTCLSEFAKTRYQQQRDFLRLSLVELARSCSVLAGIGGLLLVLGSQVTAVQVLLVQSIALLVVALPPLVYGLDWRSLLAVDDALSLLANLASKQYRHVTGYFVLMMFLGQGALLILKWLGTETELANFGAAFRIYGLLMLALASLKVVLLPTIKQSPTAREVLGVLANHRRSIPAFGVVFFVGALSSPWVIPWIDGGKYPMAPYLLQILAASAIASYALSPYSAVVMRASDYRFMFRLLAIIMPLSLGAWCFLLLYGGPYALAWGFLVANLLSNVAIWRRARWCLANEELANAQTPAARLAA